MDMIGLCVACSRVCACVCVFLYNVFSKSSIYYTIPLPIHGNGWTMKCLYGY
jgi:hypothetical protein